jgi:hypothetical protein
VNFGSGDYDSFTYDPNTGRMTQYMATITGSSAYGTMTWNANGSLYSVALTDPFNSADTGTCQHTYDDLARVSQVNCVNPGVVVEHVVGRIPVGIVCRRAAGQRGILIVRDVPERNLPADVQPEHQSPGYGMAGPIAVRFDLARPGGQAPARPRRPQ